MPAQQHISPHHNVRPENMAITLLVIHNISLPSGQFGMPHVHALFMGHLDVQADPSFAELEGLRVSSHAVIWRDGQVTQYVPLHQRAWHAGVSSYQGQPGCNDFSIGIELEGTDTLPYTQAQYDALIPLTGALLAHYPTLSVDAIVGHSDIAPQRKTDPGKAFDWHYYLEAVRHFHRV